MYFTTQELIEEINNVIDDAQDLAGMTEIDGVNDLMVRRKEALSKVVEELRELDNLKREVITRTGESFFGYDLVAEYQNKLKNKIDELSKLKENYREVIRQREQLQKEKAEWKELEKGLKEQFEKMNKELKKAKDRAQRTEDWVINSCEETCDYEAKLEEERDKAKYEADSYIAENKSLRDDIKIMIEKVEKYEKELDEKQEALDWTNKKINELKKEVENQKGQIAAYQFCIGGIKVN